MTEWQPIEAAPKDGSKAWVKREYEGRIVKEGWAVWSTMADDAPIRSGDIYGDFAPDHGYADIPRWLNENRKHAFPTPTHYRPPVPT